MNRCLLIVACLALGGLGAYLGRSFSKGEAPPAPAIPRELTSYRDVVKKVLPAVVSIEAKSRAGRAPARPGDMQLPRDRRAFVGFGSGFLAGGKGVVVTNYHVVEEADLVVVQLNDGRTFTSSKIRLDPKTDLAIIRLDVKEALPALEFGDSNDMEIGDRVLAVGAPFGLAGTVTHGIISSKGRALDVNTFEDFLQTDAAINPGNSGGPLVNLEGKVIGITSAIKSKSGGFEGVGLAISSNLGKSIVAALVKDGVVRRGYLGVGILSVNEEVARELKLEKAGGVLITHTVPKAPAEKAGVKEGDVIVRMGKKPVRNGREMQNIVAALPLGKPVEVEVIRDGKPKTLTVTIQEQPGTAGWTRPVRVPRHRIEKVGLEIGDLTAALADLLGYPEDTRGVVVLAVTRSGPAALAGIKQHSLLLSIDKTPVKTVGQARAAFAEASAKNGITIEVRDASGTKKTVILRAAR